MKKVEVQARGIKNRLKAVKPFKAIAEYIWNGFDAGANSVEIGYSTNAIGNVQELSIKDNGNGIPFDEVERKFIPILSSDKREQEETQTLTHGKNGLGRLTFFQFSDQATWSTVYKKDGDYFSYDLTVNEKNIDQYSHTANTPCTAASTGTTVNFRNPTGLSDFFFRTTLTDFLIKEFAWYLALREGQGFTILINGEHLDHKKLAKDEFLSHCQIGEHMFYLRYLQWSRKLNRHFSRIYCLDQSGAFKYSLPTSFNNKGDEFYHSVIVESEYFSSFTHVTTTPQGELLSAHTNNDKVFKNLISEINELIRAKRKPFIVEHAKLLVESYEKDGVFPQHNPKNRWEEIKHLELKNAIGQLYEIAPAIYSSLNLAQKKTFVGLLSLIIDNNATDDLFDILDGVICLTSDERARFARQLQTTRLSSVVETIELISDRFKAVADFERLVFDRKMYAGEVPHLQRMMEKNYWLIGEQYQLVTAAEPKFEEALRRHKHILHGFATATEIDHPDKNREMDLFLVRQTKSNGLIENLVVELKHPVDVYLGKEEIDQVWKYYQVIRSTPEFNAANMTWKFFLIGNRFDSTGYIPNLIESLKAHGERGLAHKGEYKIYVFTWSELFTEFKLNHDFLNERLQLELSRVDESLHETADDIVLKIRSSDGLPELSMPDAA